MKSVVIYLVVFLGVVAVCEGFQCFQCNSALPGEEHCADNPFDTTQQAGLRKDCLVDGKTCMKFVTATKEIERWCGGIPYCLTDVDEVCIDRVCSATYCCGTDNCNPASTTRHGLLLGGAMLVAARVL